MNRMDLSRLAKFRLRTLFIGIGVAAIAIGIFSYLWQKRVETRKQRDSFAALTQRAEDVYFQLRDRVESIHGPGFNTYYDGGMLATYFETPHFSYSAIINSPFGEKPAWKVELRYYARMSDYPNQHLVMVEYGPGDLNLELAKLAETVLSDEKTTVTLQAMETGE